MKRVIKKIKRILVVLGRPVYAIFGLVNYLVKISRRRIKWSLGYLFLTGLVVLSGWGMFWLYKEILIDLPSVNQIYNPPSLSSKILDKNGRLLYKFYDSENRSWVGLDKIPESLIWATLAIEDKEFYSHHGLSIRGLIRAFWYNLNKEEKDKLRGGSTISQQLVKNVFLGSEQNFKRKIKEAILTLLMERQLSKDEILERYLNQVAYGGEAYGAWEAALRYFGKNVWEINGAEAALLAGLTAAPTLYSPFGENPEFIKLRQRQVIDQMMVAGFIDGKKAEELKAVEVVLINDKKRISAPHYVFYIRDLLENKYGFRDIGKQGLIVWTSLDLEIQEAAERIVTEEIEKVKNLRISNGAVLVLEVENNNILAMVGSKDYYSSSIDGKYNVVLAPRQPGSTIKPINYLLALKNGKTLVTTIDDSPVTYYVKGQKPYTPQNYTGKYLGRVTLKTALASSLNIPSVKLLAENGIGNMIDMAESMGISTWKDRSRFGLSLALGGGEVKMIDLALAYSIFANKGKKVEINPITKIENYLGEKVFESKKEEVGVIEPKYTFLINSILSDDMARAPIFGLNSKLKIEGRTVAVKTGTTNNLKDNWCVGWTPSYLVAVWVGNNDSSPMSWVASGISGATPIWNRMMRSLVEEKGEQVWTIPEGVVKKSVCGKEEYFVEGTEKNVSCAIGPTPAGDYDDGID